MTSTDKLSSRHWVRWAAVVAGYIALSLLATWPLALHFNTDSPGADHWNGRRIFFETPTNLWNLWWFRHAVVDLHQSPFDCRHVFYPYGANLWFHSLSPVRGVIGLGMLSVLSLPATQNTILLLDLVAAGVCAYLLARQLGLGHGGAFLAGAIYAFSPGSFGHLYAGNFEQLSTFWLPAALLLFLRILENLRTRWLDGVALGLVLGGSAYACHYYAIFAGELLAVAAVLEWRRVASRTALQGLAVAAAICLVLWSPLLRAFLNTHGPRPDISSTVEFDLYSGDLASFFVPSFMNRLTASALRGIHEHLNPSPNHLPQETTLFLGFAALGLAIWGVIRNRREHRPIKLPLAIVFVFGLLSLGAHLKVWGFNTGIPLPVALFSELPLLRFARAPGRHILLVMLGLGILAGWGWQATTRNWLRVVAPILVALEYAAIPMPLFSAEVPEVYRRLRDEPGNFAVLEIPLGLRDGTVLLGEPDAAQLFAQTVHGHPIVAGVIGRVPSIRWKMILQAPVIGTLLTPGSAESRDLYLEYDKQAGPAFFSQWEIRAIVIHAVARDGPEQRYLERVFSISRRESFADGTELWWLD